MRFFPRFQTPCLLNYQTEKFQKAICSRKSRHRAAYSHVSQPLTGLGAHGPGPAAARRVSFWAWNCKESRDARCRSGLQLLQGFSDDHDEIKDSATMTGRLHLSLFVFSLQFSFGSFGRKECLNTPRPVHHELAVTVSPGPAAARRVSFWAWNCKESRVAGTGPVASLYLHFWGQNFT